MKKFLAVAMFASLTLAACGKRPEPEANRQPSRPDRPDLPVKLVDGATVLSFSDELQDTNLVRVIDKEAGVVCYRIRTDAGLSCMPLSQTKLGEPR